MKSRRELLKMLPFLAAIPFVRIPNENNVIRNWRSHPVHFTEDITPGRYWAGTTIPHDQPVIDAVIMDAAAELGATAGRELRFVLR